ncbi:hypothetical protein LJ737_15810 [Hymenobacter sp. 15J16-1T3B]|uniref:hypothetical protein n=1 Tax=Hymenobacter sp. 15J16-1T3B TaxID=2886941 RepID=UPI001D11D022|nr:hypothetical protein [Hymenobacter sp. 15J16-1T3B]MCC3158711.1 hypothetical protein [Hymenobacter sp. 15J16-1T3B]
MLLRITLCLTLGTAALMGCQTDKNVSKPDGITGYWALSRQDCNCPPNTPTPQEAIEFDGKGHVTAFENGQAKQAGTYQLATGAAACEANAPIVTLAWSGAAEPAKATYTVRGDTLVIDYGICFDAPRKTYTLAPRRAE